MASNLHYRGVYSYPQNHEPQILLYIAFWAWFGQRRVKLCGKKTLPIWATHATEITIFTSNLLIGNQQGFCSLLFTSLIFSPLEPCCTSFYTFPSSLAKVYISTPSGCMLGNLTPCFPEDKPAVLASSHWHDFQLSTLEELSSNTIACVS